MWRSTGSQMADFLDSSVALCPGKIVMMTARSFVA